MAVDQIPEEERDFSLLHSVQTGSEADPDSYQGEPEALSPGVKMIMARN
jgi:hypothetical protein